MAQRKGFSAVVESGSCSVDYRRWEERRNCGHLHRTVDAAEACGAKHYASHINELTHSWEANADWHGYTVHDQDGKRVERALQRKPTESQLAAIQELPAEFRPTETPATRGAADAAIKTGLLGMAKAGYPRPR
jgi:hypothetical protein